MDLFNLWTKDFFLLIPALQVGMEDSLNPCGLASVVTFILFLSIVGKTKKRLFFLGLFYLIAALRFQWMSCKGYWDMFMVSPKILSIIMGVYGVMAAVFFFLGVVHLMDWIHYRRTLSIEHFKIKSPVFLMGRQAEISNHRIRVILKTAALVMTAYFLGGMMTLMGSMYPQQEYIFMVHSFGLSGGNRGFVQSSFFLYSFAMVMPVIAAWVGIFYGFFAQKRRQRNIVFYKGIMFALFCSSSFSLGYFLFRQYTSLFKI